MAYKTLIAEPTPEHESEPNRQSKKTKLQHEISQDGYSEGGRLKASMEAPEVNMPNRG